jgi:hypothetical protein
MEEVKKEEVKKVGFFEESAGVKSSTRLFSFLLLLFMFGFDILIASSQEFKIDPYFIVFNFVLLIGVFIPKYLHKLAEIGSPFFKK